MNTRHPLVRGLVAAWLGLPMGAVQLAHAQEGYQLHRDIPYGEVDGRVLLVDLYLPHDVPEPPLFILHGDQDPQVPIDQSHELHGAYKALGLPVHFEVVHGCRAWGPGVQRCRAPRAGATLSGEGLEPVEP